MTSHLFMFYYKLISLSNEKNTFYPVIGPTSYRTKPAVDFAEFEIIELSATY